MALSLRKKHAGGQPQIPTASTGDIAFLILIFFMSTSMFAKEKGLKIVLPEQGEATKIKAENILTVAVNPAGQVLLGDEVVNVDRVQELIVKRLAENKELAIALRVSARGRTGVRLPSPSSRRRATGEPRPRRSPATVCAPRRKAREGRAVRAWFDTSRLRWPAPE